MARKVAHGMFMPTTWAKYDVQDPWFFDTVFRSQEHQVELRSFENSPIVRDRDSTANSSDHVWLGDDSIPHRVVVGDTIDIDVTEISEDTSASSANEGEEYNTFSYMCNSI